MTRWLSEPEKAAWTRLVAVLELMPGVLDSQLRRDSGVTHFDYMVLIGLGDAPGHTLRMSELAGRTNSTLPRLSHVVRRLEERGFVERFTCPTDARATMARLTDEGWQKVRAAAPGHVDVVRHQVIDALTPEQLEQLVGISDALLGRLDPHRAMAETYEKHPGKKPRAAGQADT